MAVESKHGQPDNPHLGVPRPGGKSLEPNDGQSLPTASKPWASFDVKGRVIDALKGDPKNPDTLTELVTLYQNSAAFVGHVKAAARALDEITGGTKK